MSCKAQINQRSAAKAKTAVDGPEDAGPRVAADAGSNKEIQLKTIRMK